MGEWDQRNLFLVGIKAYHSIFLQYPPTHVVLMSFLFLF